MRKNYLPILLLLVSVCGGLHAQTFNLTADREPVSSLDGLWRFHAGDNPAWAHPNFDDSQWPLLRSDLSWTKQGYPDYGGYAWYRFTLQVPGDGKPVGLLLPFIRTGYQVYANGELIGSAGSTGPTRDPVAAALQASIFRLPIAGHDPQIVQIALRVWEYQGYTSWLGGGSTGPGNAVGAPVLLAARLRLLREARALGFVNEYGYGLVALLVGLTILGLFFFRPDDREYLWFSVLLLAEAATVPLHLMLNLGSIPFSFWRVLDYSIEALSLIAALSFFSIVLHVRRSTFWWIACIGAAVSPLTVALFYFQWTGVGIAYAVSICFVLPAYLWIIVELAICALRKDANARLLLAPTALFYGFGVYNLIERIRWQLGGPVLGTGPLEAPLVHYPFPLHLLDVIKLIFILALLLFLVRRFSLARQQEARLSTEFEAARTMQSLLIPATPPDTRGFGVETVYLPASEVGGDFFQIQPGDDGSLLIVVGDVSGKGLKAAMTVSTIVGALRDRKERGPAEVLAHLNRVLHGQVGGFVTCTVALIAAGGAMTVSNAGNLAPYRNGREMALTNGLPLGVLAEIAFTETSYQLAPGDRLAFVSDGVVEARNTKGELYGFARTQQISDQSAQTIAEAAQSFGQEDDISVVTVVLALEGTYAV